MALPEFGVFRGGCVAATKIRLYNGRNKPLNIKDMPTVGYGNERDRSYKSYGVVFCIKERHIYLLPEGQSDV